jgi:protein ImuB
MRLDQATGAASETFAAVEPAEEFVVEQLFDFPISDREILHASIESLLARLSWTLAARCAGALRLACRFDCEGSLLKKGTGSRSIAKNNLNLRGSERARPLFQQATSEEVTLEVGLFQPTANPKHLFEILELELERLRLRAPASAISLQATRHAPLAERQHVLFDHERNLESSRPLATLINRLATRLGEQAVLRCRLQKEAQPERAYIKQPLITSNCSGPLSLWERAGVRGKLGTRPARQLQPRALPGGKPPSRPRSTPTPRHPRAKPGAEIAPLDRPLYLLRRPAPLEAISIIPEGPPVQFRRAARRHTVARYWGPERIETGWWRGQSAWRDYYRIETTEGRRYWLFRRRHDGQWFLHGIF